MKPLPQRKWWRHCGCLSSSQAQAPSDGPSKPWEVISVDNYSGHLRMELFVATG